MTKTQIAWATHVWNPVTGCTPAGDGCNNCYAKRVAETRLRGRCGYPADEPFRVTMHPDRMEDPLHLRKPARIFVCSMGDLFHDDVPGEFVARVFDVMRRCPQHQFICLTKRPQRMFDTVNIGNLPTPHMASYLANLWLGVSVWNQESAERFIPPLLDTPAAVRFASYEPALGPVDFTKLRTGDSTTPWLPALGKLDWIIAGGEAGPNARECNRSWLTTAWKQSCVHGVPFFFKSWGDNSTRNHESCGAEAATENSVNFQG